MKKFLAVLMTALAGSACTKTPESYPVHRLQTGSGETIELVLINHGSIAVRYKGLNLYVDPVNVKGRCSYASLPKADYIFITHDHFDHLDKPTIDALSKEGTRLVRAEERVDISEGIVVTAHPAYNTTPGREKFHPKGVGRGYLFSLGDKRIYVAGDTEDVPELALLKAVDVAFLPVNQPYTMTPEQCANAVRLMEPKFVIPYHMSGTSESELRACLDKTGIPYLFREELR